MTRLTQHRRRLGLPVATRVGAVGCPVTLPTTQYPELAVGDPPRPSPRTRPAHVLLHGGLAHGGTLAARIVGGRPADDTPFCREILGDDGVLALEGGGSRGRPWHGSLLDGARPGASA